MPDTTDLITLTKDAVITGFISSSQSVVGSPELIKAVAAKLEPFVERELKKLIEDESNKALGGKASYKAPTQEELMDLAQKVAGAIAEQALQGIVGEITETQAYKDFQRNISALKRDFDRSPVGIYIKENDTLMKVLLIIAGAVSVTGIATAMYVYKEGDMVANLTTKLIGDRLRTEIFKNVEIGAKGLVFKPSTRGIETRGFISANWEFLKSEFEFYLKMENDTLVETSVKGQFILPLNRAFKFGGTGLLGYNRLDSFMFYDLSLHLSYLERSGTSSTSLRAGAFFSQDEFLRKFGAEALFRYNWGGERFSFAMGGQYSRSEFFRSWKSGKNEYGAKMEFGIRF